MSSNILAIEDDKDALSNLCDILELDGYRVTAAGTLKEALEGRAWSDFSVILLDRRLPDANADTLLPQIHAAAPQVGIIVITGYADLEGTITALRSGAADYLLKPINPDLLRTAVARVLKMQDMEKRTLQAERLAAIGQMIAVLTHESGNALARSQLLLANLADEVRDRPGATELIDGLQQAQGDLRRLYDEVRNYAAPIRLERMTWDLGSIWRPAWSKVLTARTSKVEAKLVEHLDGVNLTCEVDNYRIDQVFRNLFENALTACTSGPCVEIACFDAELNGQPALRVAVRDNGPGLTAEQRDKVFAPFFTTKRKGTGLGMAIVKRIVEAHGGEIVVGNASPGAEFVITLPRELAGKTDAV
jgi:signal transduction histidine kinase